MPKVAQSARFACSVRNKNSQDIICHLQDKNIRIDTETPGEKSSKHSQN